MSLCDHQGVECVFTSLMNMEFCIGNDASYDGMYRLVIVMCLLDSNHLWLCIVYVGGRHGIFQVLKGISVFFNLRQDHCSVCFLSIIKDFPPKYDFPVIFPRSIPCLVGGYV